MGLFSQRQMDDILSIAKKSKAPTTVKKPKVRGKGITAELQRISDVVTEYFKDSQARLITTQEELHDYITNMIAAGIGAIDTETTGLDRVRDTIVGFSLYYPGDVEVYIPCNHIIPIFEEPYSHQVSYEQAQVELQRLVEAKTKLVFANADFDLGMIFKDFHVDLLPCFFYDVILAWRCLKEDERDNALKVLYNKYVLRGKGDPKKFSDFFSPTLFPYCKPEVAKLYAANDAKITYELFIWQRPYVTKNHPKCKKKHFEAISDLVWNVEFPMVAVAQRMHRRGMYIEKEVATMLRRKYHRLLEEAKQKLVDLVQECLDDTRYHARTKRPFSSAYDFNPNSTPHVKWLCYDFLGLDGGKKDATGKEILSTFGLPVTNQILYVRSLVTLIGTFVDKMPDTVASDEKLHCTFKVIGADCVTGDTLIPTSNGYHYMRNLCISSEDNVGVHRNYETPVTIVNKDQVSEDAVSCICFKDVKTIKLNLAYGLSIEGTPNHPVIVSQYTLDDFYRNKSNKMYRTILDNKHFKTLDTIKVGDLLEIPCNFDCGGSYQKTGLHLVDYRNITGADPKVPEYYDEAFAEWLGMYHADGTCMYKSGTYRIALHNCNTDVISRFSYLTKHIFNVTPTLYVPRNRKNQASSYICCMGLSDMDRILKKGANQKKIPDAIYHSPRSVINAYIKGMTLDSSVSVSSKPNMHLSFELTVTNDDDVRLIQQHLLSQGILSSIVRHNYRKDGSVLCRLKFSADHYTRFVETIGFIETDKIHYGCRNKKNPYAKIRYGNSFVVRVKSIEYKTNDVYDFHVPGTHSFISNGVISHNTGRMSSADPNLQNVPSKQADIRHMFRAMPGNVLMSSDYSLWKLAVVKPH